MLILRIWRKQPGDYFCISTKSGTGKWRDMFFTRKQFDDVPEYIADHKDKDVYFCCHGFNKPKRTKEHAVIPKLLWADLDEANPSKIKLKPSIAIESSPNRYVAFWEIDKEMTEDVNRRLSYMVGADKSGWDLGQVLRVPGTTNHKYQSKPRVKLLWDDGPKYSLSEIVSKLPIPNGHAGGSDQESDAAATFKKYEKKLPQWARRELVSGKPRPGTRSDMIWKLEHTLLEKGLTTDEAFVLIKASPWNKFRGRRNEDEQLKRELDKAINKHFDASREAVDDPEGLIFMSMADVEEENLEWLYYPYLAAGELTIMEGDPGLGKSYLAQMISGYLCDGKRLPSVEKYKTAQGRVVYFDIENSAGSVTKKRLTWNGIKNQADYYQCEEPFSIDDDETVDEIYEWLERHKPKLVVFDTLNTYLGKADAFKGHEAQQAFVRFREMAIRFNCAVLVLRHLTKSTKEKALYRGQGSIAFAGLARVVITVGSVPDDPDTKVMAVSKLNVTRRPQALEFRILGKPSLGDRDRSMFEWGDFVDLDSDEILQAPKAATQKEDAKDLISDLLEEGPVELSKLEKMCEARSVSKRTLYRAAQEMGIVKELKGFGDQKKSLWSLPENT